MHADEGLGKRMQRTKKLFDAQANAALKEHVENMADVLVVWCNEECFVRASWDADFNEDHAMHVIKFHTTSSLPTTRNRWNCSLRGTVSM